MRQSRAQGKVFFHATSFTLLNAHEKVKKLATETRQEKTYSMHHPPLNAHEETVKEYARKSGKEKTFSSHHPSLNAHEKSKEDANQPSNHMKKQRG